MRINISLQIPQERIDKHLAKQGITPQEHDFGEYRKEYHNRLEWREDIQPGIKVDGQWLTIPQYIEKKINDKLITFTLNI